MTALNEKVVMGRSWATVCVRIISSIRPFSNRFFRPFSARSKVYLLDKYSLNQYVLVDVFLATSTSSVPFLKVKSNSQTQSFYW